MLLKSITYKEYTNKPNYWALENFELNSVNLIVGKNSAGKTRLLNVINGLSKLLSGKQSTMFTSANYDVYFTDDSDEYHYELIMEDKTVKFEKLTINNKVKLSRENKAEDFIFAEELSQEMQFSISSNSIAAFLKRDTIQHAFLEKLFNWATSTNHYLFGSAFGKDHFMAYNDSTNSQVPENPDFVVQAFASAYKKFGDDFKQNILNDFQELGYPCSDIMTLEAPDLNINQQVLIHSLAVQEKDLSSPTYQLQMSQGMYRALALLIHINIKVFTKGISTLLVDDIGEGLDFQRSTKMIKLLITKAESGTFQLIMTTNDRFIMNLTHLNFWSILTRDGSIVSVINRKNSPDVFEDFQYTGLSNFDFFQKDLYSTNLE